MVMGRSRNGSLGKPQFMIYGYSSLGNMMKQVDEMREAHNHGRVDTGMASLGMIWVWGQEFTLW